MRFTMQSEAEFSVWLRSHLSKYGHVQRIENTVGNGVPDLVWCYQGITRWLELKVGCGYPQLRPEQYAWGLRHVRAGGRVYVVRYCPVHLDLHLHQFGQFEVKPHGKYVEIRTPPYFSCKASNFSGLLQSIT